MDYHEIWTFVAATILVPKEWIAKQAWSSRRWWLNGFKNCLPSETFGVQLGSDVSNNSCNFSDLTTWHSYYICSALWGWERRWDLNFCLTLSFLSIFDTFISVTLHSHKFHRRKCVQHHVSFHLTWLSWIWWYPLLLLHCQEVDSN